MISISHLSDVSDTLESYIGLNVLTLETFHTCSNRFCAVKKECVLLSMSDQKKKLFVK